MVFTESHILNKKTTFSFQQIICCWISHILPSCGSRVCPSLLGFFFFFFLHFKTWGQVLCPQKSPESPSLTWAAICPSPLWWCCPAEEGWVPQGLIHTALKSVRKVIAGYCWPKPLQTLHCCCWASEQRSRAGINPELSHGNGSITSGPTPEDFILLRHRGHASLHSASLSFPSSSNKGIAKELKKLSPVNTQAEPLVKPHLAPETCWVKLWGVGKSV